MNLRTGGALSFALAAALALPSAHAQSSQPATQPASEPASRPVELPPELPKITPKPEDGGFALVERPFPEEIAAKRFQFFQLDGYFRLRAERYINPDLALRQENGDLALGPGGLPPLGLPSPLESNPQNVNEGFGGGDAKAYATSNLRLRLEPIFNVSESVRVRAQIDVLDNVVLGSTPAAFPETGGLSPSAGQLVDLFGGSQVPIGDTIRVKRAWGEAQIPYGEIHFGRMGWHFGMGVFANDGNDLEGDFGDTVDRVALTTKLSDFLITFAYDWAASGLITAQPGDAALGQALDVSQVDDLRQYVVSAAKLYTREEEEKRRKRGELVLQYGAQGVLRLQQATSEFVVPGTSPTDPTALLADRSSNTQTLDIWGRVVFGDLHLEVEAVGVLGSASCLLNAPPGGDAGECQDPAGDQGGLPGDRLSIRAGGVVVRGDYTVGKGQWTLGVEAGAATGDQQTPFSLALQEQGVLIPKENATLSSFLFDRDFHVDLLLFRELLGTVNGAAYLKPSLIFRPLPQLTLKGSAIYSIALATDSDAGVNSPFNGEAPLGLEADAEAEYRTSENFIIRAAYGLLFPQNGLDVDLNGTEIGAKTAQTIRLQLAIAF
jgi:uncharacterized protein (TIGR04551 family)